MEKLDLDWNDVDALASLVAQRMSAKGRGENRFIFGVPRGGIFAAQALLRYLPSSWCLTDDAVRANVIVDDLIDSGQTFDRYQLLRPDVNFYALIDKRQEPYRDRWFSFPWERMQNEKSGVEDNIIRTLQFIGEDPKREGLVETPARVVKSWGEIYSGYKTDPKAVLKVFKDGACDGMVVSKGIEFYSMCEHHMLPFFGTAHIGYIPDGKVVGISKLARLLEVYSRRLQIQERIGQQVTDLIMDVLKPKGAGCILDAKHLCMCARGIGKQGSSMVTTSLRGAMLANPEARNEFYKMAGL